MTVRTLAVMASAAIPLALAAQPRMPVGGPYAHKVLSASSPDGLTWTRDPGTRLEAASDEQITDPFVVRWRDGYKMYFKSEAGRQAVQGPRPPGPMNAPTPQGRQGTGPWDHDVLVYRASEDGQPQQLATFERAGVPTVARLTDGRLIAAHQYFPADNQEAFDKVAVHFSSDEGRHWTPPQVIRLEGLDAGMRFPFDPTLVPLEDGRVRLYFTSARGRRINVDQPAIYSAVSSDGIDYTVEPGTRFGVDGRMVIDCAVVRHDGVFHLFAPDNGALGAAPEGPGRQGGAPGRGGGMVAPQPGREPRNAQDAGDADRPRIGVGYHATSTDGLTFTRRADVRLDGRRRWLGAAQSDGRRIIFFGTGDGGPGTPGGVWTATSSDGASWQLDRDRIVAGADPGAVRLKDGAWLIVVTGPPRTR